MKKKTKIEPVETPIQIEEPEDKKIVDNNLPVIGNHYYFQTDNLLIGYGILKTIEGVFDNNLKVESYRYEIVMRGISYIVTEVYSSLVKVASIIYKFQNHERTINTYNIY